MIIDDEAINTCSEILTKNDFYQKLYGMLFQIIIDLHNSQQAVDEITIMAAIGEIDLGINVEELIKELIIEVPTSVNPKDYARVVKDKAILRNIIRVGQTLEKHCYEEWDNVEDRTDKCPMMSDLRESGAIEQDADIIMFLYRDEYYNHDSEKKNTTELIRGKHREGELATIELAWLLEFTKFANKDYTQGM